MIRSADDLGAPDTDAGEGGLEQRGPQRGGPRETGAQASRHGAHEVGEAGVLLDREQVGDLDGPRVAHALEVVAHEVGDHHVLGPVLAVSPRASGRCP